MQSPGTTLQPRAMPSPTRKPSQPHRTPRPLAEAIVPDLSAAPTPPPPAGDAVEPAAEAVCELFVVYDADGTPAGELIYLTKKLLGLAHCAACDITHGPRREKPEFTQLKAGGWGVPLTNIHRDEMDAPLAAAVGAQLPCVAARTAARDVVLLGQDALAACEGDVVRFRDLVDLALAVHHLDARPRASAPRPAAAAPAAADPRRGDAACVVPKWGGDAFSGEQGAECGDAVVPAAGT